MLAIIWIQSAFCRRRFSPERVFERKISGKPCLEVSAFHRHFQLVRRTSIEHKGFGSLNLARLADSIVELPERHVVFGVIVTHRQPIAIRLDVEQNPRTAAQHARGRIV